MKINLNLGFHGGSGGGNLNGWGQWWNSLSRVNAIMADTAGPIWEIQQGRSNPQDTLVYRMSLVKDGFDPNTPNYRGNPEDEATRMILTKRNNYWPSELDTARVWLKDTNEIRTKVNNPNDTFWNNLEPGEWWGRYALKAAEITVARNERVILLSPSSGDHTWEFWDQPAMVEFLDYASRHKDKIAIGLHEYSYTKSNILDPFDLDSYENSITEDRKIGRFEIVFDVCDTYNVEWPMLYFCEWGWEYQDIPDTNKALDDIRLVTQYVYGPFYKYILGFGTWYLGPGYGDIANKVNGLLLPSAEISNTEIFTVEERMPGGNTMACDCPAIADVRTVSLWIPQYNILTQEELDQVLDWAKNGFILPDGTKTSGNHMLCPSHVDALRIHTEGLPGSILAVCYPEKIGTGVTVEWIENNCSCAFDEKQVVFLGGTYIENPFLRLPTDTIRLSQLFGENPENYIQFGLPGHEGIDIPVPNGTPVYATVRGTVSAITTTGNYGNCVRIRTVSAGETFELIFAHLQSFNVVLNQQVNENTIIGLSNNTGNSSGPHLHFAVKVLGRTYIDSLGRWPFNFHNPMLWLADLYEKKVTGINGYLYLSSLKVDDTSNIGYTKGALNLRAMPTADSTLLGVVPTGDVVRVISATPVNGYVYCQTNLVTLTTRADYGLHARANPDTLSQAEYVAIQKLISSGGKTVKLLHNHPTAVFNVIRSYKPSYVVIRVMQSWGGRRITPEEFVNWTADELIQKVNALSGIPVLVEVHNEPNLYDEGFSYSWSNGAEFGNFFNSVVKLYKVRPELQAVKFMFPGLSPGGTISNVRYNSIAFLSEAVTVGLLADCYGLHTYWQDNYSMESAINSINAHRNIIPGKDIYVTECSRNDVPATQPPSVYGKEYAQFTKLGVKAVYFFVGSGSSFPDEAWVTEAGVDKGITEAFLSNL